MPEKHDEGNQSAPLVKETVQAGVTALAALRAAAGDAHGAMELNVAAPAIARTAEHGYVWVGRAAERVWESMGRVFSRAKEEGVPLEEAADVIAAAIPILADEATEEKRRMVEQIILNAGRAIEGEASTVRALTAFSLLRDLEPHAVLVFAILATDPEGAATGGAIAARLKLPRPLVMDALRPMLPQRTHGARDLHLVEAQDAQGDQYFALGELGMWLARWISDHPRE